MFFFYPFFQCIFPMNLLVLFSLYRLMNDFLWVTMLVSLLPPSLVFFHLGLPFLGSSVFIFHLSLSPSLYIWIPNFTFCVVILFFVL